MPKAQTPSVELRALPTFEHLPGGHATFWVNSDGSAPHLNIGEFAVIDTTDRKLQHGELYLKQSDTGLRDRSISQAKLDRSVLRVDDEDEPLWVLHQLRGFRRARKLDSGIPLFTGLCDGHYPTSWLEEQLLGRVVGVSSAPLGALLEPAAGYVDEEANNAAFDEGQYLDVMIATGHQPCVTRGRDGKWHYWENVADRNFERFSEEEVFELKRRESAASTGMDRVIAECVRRGLIG